MSGISTITQAPGFDQQCYDKLIQEAKTARVDTGVVDSLLLSALKNGKSFDQALALVGSDLPKLATPTGAAMALLKDWPALPSPGALIMSVTTEFAAEQRRQNQELMWQETKAISQSMQDQAKEMRTAAKTQLALGIASGLVQLGMGIAQVGMGARAAANAAVKAKEVSSNHINTAGAKAYSKAIDGGKSVQQATAASQRAMAKAETAATKLSSEAFNSAIMKANMNIGAVGQMGGGVGRMLDAGAQYAGSMMQARVKEMEADQETMRAMRDAVKNLDEGLRALIQKSLAAQNDIMASTNQARTKILA
jgi:hypothetical protein